MEEKLKQLELSLAAATMLVGMLTAALTFMKALHALRTPSPADTASE